MNENEVRTIKSFQQHAKKILKQFSVAIEDTNEAIDYELVIDACNRIYGAVDLLLRNIPVEEMQKVCLKQQQNAVQDTISKMSQEMQDESEHRH